MLAMYLHEKGGVHPVTQKRFRGLPSACIASAVEGDKVVFAIAAWNEKLDKDEFQKPVSRRIAEGRLKAGLIAGEVAKEGHVLVSILNAIINGKMLRCKCMHADERHEKRRECKVRACPCTRYDTSWPTRIREAAKRLLRDLERRAAFREAAEELEKEEGNGAGMVHEALEEMPREKLLPPLPGDMGHSQI